MIKLKIGEELLSLPTAWHEVTVEAWIRLQKQWNGKDFVKLIAILADNNAAMLADVNQIVEKTAPRLSFLSKPPKLSVSDLPSSIVIDGQDYKVPLDLRRLPYRVKMYLQQYVTKATEQNQTVDDLLPFVIALIFYEAKAWTIEGVNEYQEKTVSCLYVQALPVVLYFLDQLEDVLKTEAEKLSSSFSQDEVSAGVKRFAVFGNWASVYALAGSILNVDKVLALPYDDIYLTLRFEKEQADFRRRLSDITRKRKK